jgi:hypothetical protein
VSGSEAHRFLARVALAAVLLLAPLVALNVAVDPYGLFMRPQSLIGGCIGGFRAGGVDALQLAVERSAPQVLLVGNSRVLTGHDAADPSLQALGSGAFNFAWTAAAFDEVRGRVAQATAQRPPRAIVVGIGAGDLMPQARLETVGARSAPRWRIVLRGLIGATAAVASLRALANPRACRDPQQRMNGDASASLGRPDPPPYPESIIRAVDASLAHSYAYAAARWRERPVPEPAAAAGFSRLLDDACARGTRVVAFFEPLHARLLEIVWQSGAWAAMETIRRNIAGEVARVRNAGCDVELWDFIQYHPYTTGAHTGSPPHFAEGSHYTPLLGRIMTRRMLDPAASGDKDFGTRADPRTVAARSIALRAERERWIATHPEVAAYVRALLDAVPARAIRRRDRERPR